MKIKKLNEDIQHCWFGYYIDRDGNKKYFYMTVDSTSKDPDEASDIMEDSIPEPFTKFVFQGSVANTQAEKQGMKLIEAKSINEAKTARIFGAKGKKLAESTDDYDEFISIDTIKQAAKAYNYYGNIDDEIEELGDDSDTLERIYSDIIDVGTAVMNKQLGQWRFLLQSETDFDEPVIETEHGYYAVSSRGSIALVPIREEDVFHLNESATSKLNDMKKWTRKITKTIYDLVQSGAFGENIKSTYADVEIRKMSNEDMIIGRFRIKGARAHDIISQCKEIPEVKQLLDNCPYDVYISDNEHILYGTTIGLDIVNIYVSDKDNQSNTELKESATHAVYFTQDGIEQIEFRGTEDECQQYISDIEAEQDDEFGDEAPERFVKRLTEAKNEKVTLYYDDIEVQVGHGDGAGHYDYSIGGWMPDDDYRTIRVDYEYDVDKDEVIDHIDYFIFKEDPNFTDKFETDEEYNKYLEDNFDELFDKYEEKILDKFRDDATDHAQEHGNFNESLKEASTSDKILYVIKDKNGNQLSAPNPDDSELWDRVESMEARGRRGLCVVVYTGKKESLAEDKGQPRSNRYRTYFNRIKKAIEKGDEETLKRTKEAIMYAPAKELKNSEANELMNMIKNRKINEASYGGAFDIADDQFFTREDIENAAEEVMNHIDETFTEKYVLGGTWFEDGKWIVNVKSEDGAWEFEELIRVDMRKIKEPWHLKRAYATEMAAKLINSIKEQTQPITEAYEGTYSDKFRALAKKYYEDAPTEDALLVLINDIIRYCPEDDLKDLWIRYSKHYEKDLEEDLDPEAKEIEDMNTGMAIMINDLIKDEFDAIDGYNSAIATALAEGHDDIVNVLVDIQAEEHVHVGQLQEIAKLFDPNAKNVENGEEEAETQIEYKAD